MRRAQRTDLFREMKKSFNRYISILLIMALGVAFYAGVRSAEPDMQLSAKDFYDSTSYMDIRVLGTLGMTESDVEEIGKIEGIACTEGGYQAELFLEAGERDYQMNVYSLGDSINHVHLLEGRLPENAKECFMDNEFMAKMGYQLGDVITLHTEEDKELSDTLAEDTFTIVGAGSFPMYLSWNRGSVSIGTGVEDGFLFVPKSAFSMEVFTAVYALMDNAKELNPYEEEYEERSESIVEKIEAIAGERCDIRYGEVTDPYWEDIAEAEAEIADGEKELADGEQKLLDAEKELADAEVEIADAEKKIADGEMEIADGEAELLDAAKEIEDGEKKIADAEVELADAVKEIEDGEKKIADAEVELEDAAKEIADGEKQIADGEAELADAAKEIADGEKQIADAEVELEDAAKEIADGEQQIADAEVELEDAAKEIADGEQQIADAEAELADAAKEIADGEQQIADGEKELEDAAQKLADGEGQIAENEALLVGAKDQLTAGREQLEAGKQLLAAQEAEFNQIKAALEVNGLPLTEELLAVQAQLEAAKQQMTVKESELVAGEVQLGAGETALAAAKKELEEGRKAYEEGLTEIETAKAELADGKKKYEDGLAELETAKAELTDGKKKYEDGLAELETAKAELADGKKQYEDGLLELEEAKAELADGKKKYEDGLAEIETAKSELADGRKKYEDGLAEIETAKAELADGKKQYEDGRSELETAKAELADGKKKYEDGKAELEDARLELENGKKELEDGRKKLADAKVEIEDAKVELSDGRKELEDGKAELSEAKADLEEVEVPEWIVLDRSKDMQFVEYGMNSERIGNLGDVFPAVFYLVAALVSLTTMTRMVEEERTQIGTMKALGYSKGAIVSKYVWYALSATLLGGVIGVLVGSYFFPWVIINAYGILYTNIPNIISPVQWELSLISVLIAVGCTLLATLSSCYKEMMAAPAILMRPVAPAAGKRVFLEYIKPLWNHMNFSWKATCRNLFRYKKRFFMTIFGIGGCMALLLVGFGLRDSIMEIVNNQYKKIWTYDAYLSVNDTVLDFTENAEAEKIEDSMYIQSIALDVESEAALKSVTLFVPERISGLEEFLKLQDRVTGEKYVLEEHGVILSEKLARMLEVKVGDEIELHIDDVTKKPVEITAVAENYMANYVYISTAQYEVLFEEPADYNQLYLQLADMTKEEEENFSSAMLSHEEVDSVTYVHELQESVATMMQALELVVVVLIVAAGMLAFIVLYNLNNINIIERRRELATLKVLGFYDIEVGSYVYRENVLLTLFGIAAGVIMGFFLHRYVILTVEVDMIMFGREIEFPSYIYSIILTCVFALLINFSMLFKLKKIDMVESLKSAE